MLYCTSQIARAYILLGLISFLLIAILSRLYFSSVACCMGRRSRSRYFRYEMSFFNRGPNNKTKCLSLTRGIKQVVRWICLTEIGLICNGFIFASDVLPSSWWLVHLQSLIHILLAYDRCLQGLLNVVGPFKLLDSCAFFCFWLLESSGSLIKVGSYYIHM